MIAPVDFAGHWARVHATGCPRDGGGCDGTHRRSPPRDALRDLPASSYLTVSFAEPTLACVLPATSVAYTVYV